MPQSCRSSLCSLAILALFAPHAAQTLAGSSAAQQPFRQRGPVPREAYLVDLDADGALGSGDELRVVFDVDVTLTSPAQVVLELPVAGDSLGFGAAATSAAGNVLVFVLGDGAQLRTRGAFSANDVDAGSPSGVSISSATSHGALTGTSSGLDAEDAIVADVRPWFSTDSTWSFAATTAGLYARDFDGDGDLDVLAHAQGEESKLWLNFFGGSFAWLGDTVGTSTTTMFEFGDFDRDGDLDVVEGRGGGAAYVWSSTGAGFEDSPHGLGSSGMVAIRIGDLDGDGLLDAVVSKPTGKTEVLVQEAYFAFHQPTAPYSPPGAQALAIGDLDADGDLDFAAANLGAQDAIYTNDGSGVFTRHGLGSPSLTFDSLDVLALDLEHDGDTDLVTVGSGSQGLLVWRNGEDGFAPGGGGVLASSTDRGLAPGDVDQDGDPDVLVGADGAPAELWWNDGGVLRPALLELPTTQGTAIALARIDPDGDLDLLLGDSSGADLVLAGSSQAGWGKPAFVATGQVFFPRPSEDLALADLDGDGDLDFAIANSGQSNQTFRNDGEGLFTELLPFGPPTPETRAIVAGDVNGDGQIDLITGDRLATPSTRVYSPLGSGWYMPLDVFGDDDNFGLALGDVDGDGDLDLASATDQTNWLRHNVGDGHFSFVGLSFGSSDTKAATFGDVDGDGDLDLACANGTDEPDQIWLNQGAGFLVDSGQDLGTGPSTSVAFGDVDGDGDLDLAIGRSSSPDTIWRNSNGVFAATEQSLPVGGTTSVVFGDLDGDGDLDLVLARAGALLERVFWNDGAGNFVDSGLTLGAFNTQAAALGDLDLDGDLDLVFAHKNAAPGVWLNQ